MEDETATSDDDVEGEKTFQGHSGGGGLVEPPHQGVDYDRGGCSWAVPGGEDGGEVMVRRWQVGLVGGGSKDGQPERRRSLVAG